MWEMIFSWNTLRFLMWPLYVLACGGLIVIVLLQKGKGAGFAGAFGLGGGGGGGSDAIFGPRARKSLPVRLTYVMAAVFIVFALLLSVIEGKVARGKAPELVEAEEQGTIESGIEGWGEAYSGEETEVEATPEGGVDAAPDQPQAQPSMTVEETAPEEDVTPPSEGEIPPVQ